MTGLGPGLLAFGIALLLCVLRVPVAISMGVVGFAGSLILQGANTTFYVTGTTAFDNVKNYGLSVVPLFVFMGVFASRAGLSRALYDFIYSFLGRLRGGLAIATIGACAGFGAICGSSLATCATIGRIALPEMLRRNYSPELAMGSVAAGGTLGILIPPSIIMVIYGLITSTSIGALFAAAFVPGIIATLLYMFAVTYTVRRNPKAGPAGERMSKEQRWRAVRDVWQVALLFIVTIGGIYAGVFSPTEAAAIGAGGALLIAALQGNFTWRTLWDGLIETAVTSGMIFTILIGSALFNVLIEATGLPAAVTAAIGASGFSYTTVLVLIIVFYVILGCFMDSLSMIVLTLPVVYPITVQFHMDPIWFGIIITTVVEIGLITPPIGLNLFVVQGLYPQAGQKAVIRGVAPFITADLLRITILASVPAITLWLPRLLGF
ncbi:MAG TPA: TRAP transporter large permease [Pseudolabrys sp.]|nr:TRAP transporter large permease [Pseudolabrys sp.]